MERFNLEEMEDFLAECQMQPDERRTLAVFLDAYPTRTLKTMAKVIAKIARGRKTGANPYQLPAGDPMATEL